MVHAGAGGGVGAAGAGVGAGGELVDHHSLEDVGSGSGCQIVLAIRSSPRPKATREARGMGVQDGGKGGVGAYW